MNLNKHRMTGVLSALAMAALILDAKTALVCAKTSIELCINVLIPSLFPFFIFSNILISAGTDNLRLSKPVCRFLRIPEGAESILLVGFLGGYPAGAQAIATASSAGTLNEKDGKRMMAFCCNAGPAFFFGIGMQIFNDLRLCIICWLVHIIGAIMVAMMTPGKPSTAKISVKSSSITFTNALQKAIRTMATVCGWVILMKILMGFFEHWLFWLLPTMLQNIFFGILEISSGCCSLIGSNNIGVCIILFSAYTAFGGMCVWLQTISVTENHVDISMYLPGKLTQPAISILLTELPHALQFNNTGGMLPIIVVAICAIWILIYALFFAKRKIGVEITQKIVYNQAKASGGVI